MVGIGRRVYGLGAVVLGVVELAYGGFSADWLPVSAHTPGYGVLLYAVAGLLILGGVAINVGRTAAIGALGLAALFALAVLVVHLPHALAKPGEWVSWQAVAESTAVALGGVLAYAQLGMGPGGGTRAAATLRIARLLFGVCLLVFGASHFVYARLTASLVPAWLPPSQAVWVYVTGAAQIAAGLAMLSRVRARLAAILLSAMYAAFSLLVHFPSLMAAPSSHDNWAENGLNLLLLGAAWSLAESLSQTRGRS